MFKKFIIFVVLVCTLFSFGSSYAAADEKIALVSLQKALNMVNEGKKIKAQLKKEFESKKKKITAMKTELEKMGKDLEKQKMVLSQQALQEKQRNLQAKFMDLQNKAMTFERELKTKEAQSAKKILLALRNIVIDLSKKEGYTLVLENSTETVLFSSTGEDITPKVIAIYNKKNK